MTTQTPKSISFNVSKSTGWKDAFVVGFPSPSSSAHSWRRISSTPSRAQGTFPFSASASSTTASPG